MERIKTQPQDQELNELPTAWDHWTQDKVPGPEGAPTQITADAGMVPSGGISDLLNRDEWGRGTGEKLACLSNSKGPE